ARQGGPRALSTGLGALRSAPRSGSVARAAGTRAPAELRVRRRGAVPSRPVPARRATERAGRSGLPGGARGEEGLPAGARAGAARTIRARTQGSRTRARALRGAADARAQERVRRRRTLRPCVVPLPHGTRRPGGVGGAF